jgi:hypothetical protein
MENFNKHIGRNAYEVLCDLNLDPDEFLDLLFDQDLYSCTKCGKIVLISDIPNFELSICIDCDRGLSHG